FGGPDAVRALPRGDEWLRVIEQAPKRQRHLAVHTGHCVELNAADEACWRAGGSSTLRDVTLSGTRDQIRLPLGDYSDRGAAEDGSDIRTEAEVPGQPSGLGWLPDGRLLVVSMRDGRLLRRETDGTLVCHADLSGCINGHLNDMVVDTDGRAFVGEFGFDLMGGTDFRPAGL